MQMLSLSAIHHNNNMYKASSKPSKLDKENKQQLPCQVCWSKRQDDHDFQKLKCKDCGRCVHRHCYYPNIKQKHKFRCDQCKKGTYKSRQSRHACVVCSRNDGMLKDVGNGQWMHVFCALTSKLATLTSYKTLEFKLSSVQQKKMVGKQLCVNCRCKKTSGLKCRIQGCTNFTHMQCVVHDGALANDDQYPSFTTIGLMDKNKGCFKIKYKGKSQGMQLLHAIQNKITYFVCAQHNNQNFFVQCPCGQAGIDDQMACCDVCTRWYHRSCMGNNISTCPGCIKKNIYQKNMRLPELISRAFELQNSNNFDNQNIKFLDHFSLKWSDLLQKNVQDDKNLRKIQRYFLRQYLESLNYEASEHKEQLKDTKNQQQSYLLKILFFLSNRQIRQQDEISQQQIQKMIVEFNTDSKYLTNSNKAKAVQKRFTPFLQKLLKKMQTQDARMLKSQLTNFLQSETTDQKTLTQSILSITKIMQELPNLNIIKQPSSERILQLFTSANFTQQEILASIQILGIAIRGKQTGNINQNDLKKIETDISKMAATKRKKFQQIISYFLQNVKIAKQYDLRQKIFKDSCSFFQKSTQPEQRQEIKAELARKGVMIGAQSPLAVVERNQLELQIRKFRYQKKCNQGLQDTKEAMEDLQKQLVLNEKLNCLDREYVCKLKQAQAIYKFIGMMQEFKETMSNQQDQSQFGSDVIPSSSDQKNQSIVAENPKENIQATKGLAQKLNKLVQSWRFQYKKQIQYAISSLFAFLKENIVISQSTYILLRDFTIKAQAALQQRLQQYDQKINSKCLQQVCTILKYFKLEGQYSTLIKLQKWYLDWKQPYEWLCINIIQQLQNHKKLNDMLQGLTEIESKQTQMDLSMEYRKLKVLKMWCLISQKLIKQPKATITAIHQTKALMDKIQYPENNLRKNIQRLEKEAKSLNKRISRFLEKPKLNQMEYFEELRHMSSKMTIEEALQLKNQLQKSELDVEVQLQELNQQIKQFKNFPKNMSDFLKKKPNLQQMGQLKNKIIQNSFNYNIENYQLLYRGIYSAKCEQFQSGKTISKKQYMKCLNYGGVAGTQLLNSTHSLFKAYRDIQIAQKQMFSSKPRYQILLPNDPKKYLNPLKADPIQRAKVQKWFSLYQKLKQRYRSNKINRASVQKLIQIQLQLNRLPINCRHQLSQISQTRRILQDLTSNARSFLGDSISNGITQFQSPFTADMLERYRICGARNDFMDRFQFIITKNRQIMQLGNIGSVDNYKLFSVCCQQAAQLMHNNQVYKIRQVYFHKMAQVYMQSEQPLTQIGYTLISEGSALCRRPGKAQHILPLTLKIHQRFYKWDSGMRHSNANDIRQEQQEQEDQMDQQDQDISEEYDDDSMDLQGQYGMGKRNRGEVVDLDEEQDEEDQNVL